MSATSNLTIMTSWAFLMQNTPQFVVYKLYWLKCNLLYLFAPACVPRNEWLFAVGNRVSLEIILTSMHCCCKIASIRLTLRKIVLRSPSHNPPPTPTPAVIPLSCAVWFSIYNINYTASPLLSFAFSLQHHPIRAQVIVTNLTLGVRATSRSERCPSGLTCLSHKTDISLRSSLNSW